jgi:hypothetical protein
MVAWTKRKKGLHDKVAETLVVLGPAPVGGGIRTLIVFGVLFFRRRDEPEYFSGSAENTRTPRTRMSRKTAQTTTLRVAIRRPLRNLRLCLRPMKQLPVSPECQSFGKHHRRPNQRQFNSHCGTNATFHACGGHC